jgi:hypothetical protein
MFDEMRAISSRACWTVAPGASRANTSDIRCDLLVCIVALKWCGLVPMFA